MVEFIRHLLSTHHLIGWMAVASYVAGVLTVIGPIHYSEWLKRAREKQDAARFLKRSLARIADELFQVDFQCRNLPNRPDYFGGMPLEHVRKWVGELREQNHRIGDLHDERLEVIVQSAIDGLHEYGDRLYSYVESLRERPLSEPSEPPHSVYYRRHGLVNECMETHFLSIKAAQLMLGKYARHPFKHCLPMPMPKDLQPKKPRRGK